MQSASCRSQGAHIHEAHGGASAQSSASTDSACGPLKGDQRAVVVQRQLADVADLARRRGGEGRATTASSCRPSRSADAGHGHHMPCWPIRLCGAIARSRATPFRRRLYPRRPARRWRFIDRPWRPIPDEAVPGLVITTDRRISRPDPVRCALFICNALSGADEDVQGSRLPGDRPLQLTL